MLVYTIFYKIISRFCQTILVGKILTSTYTKAFYNNEFQNLHPYEGKQRLQKSCNYH